MTTATQAPARFSAAHRALNEALGLVSIGVFSKAQIPALRGVVAETTESAVTLRAFDFETAVSVRVDGEAGDVGVSLLDHDELKRILAAAVAGETPVVAARTRVSVAGDVLSTPELAVPLTALELEQYPAMPPDAPAMVTVDGAEWFRQLARVLPAAGSDDMLPTLTAVRLELKAGALRMTATDRYRIAVAEVPSDGWTDGGEQPVTALVPSAVLAQVAKRLGKYTGPVSVGVHTEGSTFATVTVGPATFTVRCLEGDFLEVDRIFPTEALPVTVTVGRVPLVRAVKKATALAKAKNGDLTTVGLEFHPDGQVTVSPWVSDTAARAKVRGVDVPGSTVTWDGALDAPLLANGAFLLDALGAFAGDTVTVHVRGAVRKPFLLTDGPSVAGEGYRHLMMPVYPER